MSITAKNLTIGVITSSGPLATKIIIAPIGFKNLVHVIHVNNIASADAFIGVWRADLSNSYQFTQISIPATQSFDIVLGSEGWVIEDGHGIILTLEFWNGIAGTVNYSVDGSEES